MDTKIRVFKKWDPKAVPKTSYYGLRKAGHEKGYKKWNLGERVYALLFSLKWLSKKKAEDSFFYGGFALQEVINRPLMVN